MSLEMGVSVMSALAKSNIHSLTWLDLSENKSWWKNSTVFNQLLPFLSQQTQLKKFWFSINYLTSE